ncbi:YfdQ family protein [Aeromonas veronii]
MTTHSVDDLSAYCKAHCGLDAKAVADIALVSRRTLYNWWQTRRRTVELIVSGVNTELESKNMSNIGS